MKNIVSNDIKNNTVSRTDFRKVKFVAILTCVLLFSVLNFFAKETHRPSTWIKLHKKTTINELEKLKRFNNCKESYQVFNNNGIIFSDNNFGEAEYNYHKALMLEPENDYILYNLANVQLQQKKNILAAQTYYNLLGNQNFDQDLINFYLGIANENEGNLIEALKYYKSSQKFEAAFNASIILRNQDNVLEALKEAKRSIELNTTSEEALYNYSALSFLEFL